MDRQTDSTSTYVYGRTQSVKKQNREKMTEKSGAFGLDLGGMGGSGRTQRRGGLNSFIEMRDPHGVDVGTGQVEETVSVRVLQRE